MEIRFQKEPIDISAACFQTGGGDDGSVVIFIGQPRRESNGKTVTHLEYEIYEEMAQKEMKKILGEAAGRWPVSGCLVIHRYGRVEIGEASIVIRVSSPHRDEGFQASRFIIDTIKKTVPVWKKECYNDGSSWVSDRS
ncbi:MAG: molybdenum cofactor biosynthesis protein MoaE [Spirochaetia bacterium]|jgi:molybdopterin synthase catalytic subunit|nr:molybdenum cofactor biosynthesis protein MoaE [Spirochaetia bacterium]